MEDIFEELAAPGTDDEGREEDNPGGNKDDEAVEANDTRRVVKPKRVVSRPQPKLDTTRLLGPRGIFTVKSSFDNIKFKGKGHELDDLNNVLSRLQHWAHRLFPKMTFEDCIEKIENLGSKREILTNMHKLRMGMVDLDGGVQTQDDVHVDDDPVATPPAEDNAFYQLVATVPAAPTTTLTEEQRARMMRNRLLAEERRMARRLAREKELEEQRQTTNMAADESRSSGVADVEMSNTPVAEYVNTPGSDPELATNSVSCATNVNNDRTLPLATNGTDQDNVSSSSSTVPVDPSLSIDPQQTLLHSADEVSTATCVDNTSSPGTSN